LAIGITDAAATQNVRSIRTEFEAKEWFEPDTRGKSSPNVNDDLRIV
jgi:hypothetical protein